MSRFKLQTARDCMSFQDEIASNPLRRDAFRQAVDVVKHMREVQLVHREYDLTRQFIRAIISIGSNLAESKGSNSTEMLVSKLEIAYRESCEARFHVAVLMESGLVNASVAEDLDGRIDSMAARLFSSIRRLRHSTESAGRNSRFK